jgi:transposase
VLIADATKVKGLAPLACKTDKIDARVLATLSARDLVPEIWLPGPSIRRERELARFRLHLVRHRTTLKNRIHAALIAFGHPCPVSDLFGHAGREHGHPAALGQRRPAGQEAPTLEEVTKDCLLRAELLEAAE